jgi:hypothetical protein
MNRLDKELRNVVRRDDPPEGFAERVIARAAEEKPRIWMSIFAARGLRWAMTGAVCLMLAFAGIEYRQARQERARGEAAKERLMLALRIAGNKLQYAQAKIQPTAYRTK